MEGDAWHADGDKWRLHHLSLPLSRPLSPCSLHLLLALLLSIILFFWAIARKWGLIFAAAGAARVIRHCYYMSVCIVCTRSRGEREGVYGSIRGLLGCGWGEQAARKLCMHERGKEGKGGERERERSHVPSVTRAAEEGTFMRIFLPSSVTSVKGSGHTTFGTCYYRGLTLVQVPVPPPTLPW